MQTENCQENKNAASVCYANSCGGIPGDAILLHPQEVGDTGFEGNPVSSSTAIAYKKHCDPRNVKSDVHAEAPILTASRPVIPADLAVVVNAWEHLSAEAKKDILAIVRQEHINVRGGWL